MPTQTESDADKQGGDVKKTVRFEDLENVLTVTVDLRPGRNRLVVKVREDFLFSV